MHSTFWNNFNFLLGEAQGEALFELAESNSEYEEMTQEYSLLRERLEELTMQKQEKIPSELKSILQRMLELQDKIAVPEKSAVYLKGVRDCISLCKKMGWIV